MSDLTEPRYDVIVVGGGPAGSATAGLLAQEGRSVLLLEREKFPRYHIGESLIPGVLQTLDRLGLQQRLKDSDFVRKYGGSLVWGKGLPLWSFSFDQGGPYEHAYQVRRADFDALLLTRARELGAHVVEEATVREPVMDGDRMTGVRYRTSAKKETVTARARIVVDATGQQRWLGRHFDMVDWHEDLRNIAVWSYHQGCLRFPGKAAGNILTEYRPGGWIWFIPLHDGTTSIGYVTPTAELAKTGLTPEELYVKQVEGSREVRRLMEPSVQVSDYRTIRDWSYNCTSFQGPGWLCVGDAAAFVDPLLSTGVTLALRGAATAAKAAGRMLTDPETAAQTGQAYERSYRNFLDGILAYVREFYQQDYSTEEYFEQASKVLDRDVDLPAKADFVTLVSGLSEGGDFFERPMETSDELWERLRVRVEAPPMNTMATGGTE
ncbi:NAD(P)/FAD-dependent oxidoreductase [Streptomyces sp. NPDC048172]|uniref:NAD(P)/FAD-dependent oxidoreductase n=1 Tax=Streptomyces sp. NPDC048172 TaxID=3365505 RepID=UPI003720C28B